MDSLNVSTCVLATDRQFMLEDNPYGSYRQLSRIIHSGRRGVRFQPRIAYLPDAGGVALPGRGAAAGSTRRA